MGLALLLVDADEPWWRRTAGINGGGQTLARVEGGAHAELARRGDAGGRR
jgi:hypothetical protein